MTASPTGSSRPSPGILPYADVTAVNKTMKFKDTVRIRKERSTESDRIANGYVNDDVKVIENYSDGWSKVEYNGVTGYCKTEFLKEAN